MKILLISNIFPPGFIGGYELGAFEVASGLAKLGHQVKVLTSDYFLPIREPESNLTVESTLSCPPLQHELHQADRNNVLGKYFVFHNIRHVASAIGSWRPDILLLFNIQGLGALALLRFITATSIPTVHYLMDDPLFGIQHDSKEFQTFIRMFGEVSISHNLFFIAMSGNVATQTGKSLRQNIDPALLVPGWIHPGDYDPPGQLSSREGVVKFVFCSRIAPHKGTEITLDAIEALSRDGERRFLVDFYGSGQVAQFTQAIRARGLSQFARYKGSLPKEAMTKAFAAYDALLFPTWEREPFGFVVSEAAAAGCIPIITASIGASEWFFNELECLKIERNPHSLKSAMALICALPTQALLELRLAAQRASHAATPFGLWLPQIEQVCQKAAASATEFPTLRRLASLRAAFQFLGEVWKDQAQVRG